MSDWESLRVQLNLPAVEEEEVSDEMEGFAEIPVLHPEKQATDDIDEVYPDDAAVAAAEARVDAGFEEIIATEWPDATTPATVVEHEEDAEDATVSGA